jgi:hypothetical protein
LNFQSRIIGMSLLFGLANAKAREAFLDKCLKIYGLAPESLYPTGFGTYVVVDNLSESTAEMLRREPEVKNVFEDDSLHPF